MSPIPLRLHLRGIDCEGCARRVRRYGLLALLVLAMGLVGYAGYELYPRFDLPAVEGVSLLLLAVGAGVACFFSPCAFSLLLTLLGREVQTGAGSEGDESGGSGIGGPFRFASALSLGATAFLLVLGGVIAFGGRTLVGDVVFTSTEGRILRLTVGLFLVLLGLVQIDLLPNPLHALEDALRPLFRKQAEVRRARPFVGHTLFGFGYLLAGFG